jgi:hypothetical protein
VALTLIGDDGPGSASVLAGAALVSLGTAVLAGVRMASTPAPFLDLRLLRDRVFGSAVLVSLLTGYALSTVIVGMAAFVDRVIFAGPEQQRLVLGTLALAMALGAASSGLVMRRLGATAVTLSGLAAAVVGLVVLSGLSADTTEGILLGGLALFGLGFGLTVTPRSSVAVEAAGRAAFGMASAAVTVARMAGMAVGLAILTAFGTSRIDTVTLALGDQAFRDSILPPELLGRPLQDPLVLAALEAWAAREAAGVLGSLFLVAAALLIVAVPPSLAMRAFDRAQVARPTGGIDIGEGRAW